jgi:hypothetical protein
MLLFAGDLDAQFQDVVGMDESQSRGENKFVFIKFFQQLENMLILFPQLHRYVLKDDENSTLLLFRPFVLGCRSNTPRIVEVSLDCLQKLIENGYVRGHIRQDLYGSTKSG